MEVKIALVLLCALPMYCKSVGDSVRNPKQLQQESIKTVKKDKNRIEVYDRKRTTATLKQNAEVMNNFAKKLQETRSPSELPRNRKGEKETAPSPVTKSIPLQLEDHIKTAQRITTQVQDRSDQKTKSKDIQSALNMTRSSSKQVTTVRLDDGESKQTMETVKKSRSKRSLNKIFGIPEAVYEFLLSVAPGAHKNTVYKNSTDETNSNKVNGRNAFNLVSQEKLENKEQNIINRSKKQIGYELGKTTVPAKSKSEKQFQDRQLENLHKRESIPGKTSNILHEQKPQHKTKEIRVGNVEMLIEYVDEEEDTTSKRNTKHENSNSNRKPKQVRVGHIDLIKEHVDQEKGKTKQIRVGDIDMIFEYEDQEEDTTRKKNMKHEISKYNGKQETDLLGKSMFSEKPKTNPGLSKQVGHIDMIKEHVDQEKGKTKRITVGDIDMIVEYVDQKEDPTKKVNMKYKNSKSNGIQQLGLMGKSGLTEKPKSYPGLSNQVRVGNINKDQVEETTNKINLKHENSKSTVKREIDLLGDINTIINILNKYIDQKEDTISKKTLEQKNSKSRKRETDLLGKSMFTDNPKFIPGISKQVSLRDIVMMKKYIDQVEDTIRKENMKYKISKNTHNGKQQLALLGKPINTEKPKSNPNLSKQVRVSHIDKKKEQIGHLEDNTSKNNSNQENNKRNVKREIDLLEKHMFTEKPKSNPILSKQVRVSHIDMKQEQVDQLKYKTSEKNAKEENKINVKREIDLLEKHTFTEKPKFNPGMSKYARVSDIDTLIDMITAYMHQDEDTASIENLEKENSKINKKREKNVVEKSVFTKKTNSNPGLPKQLSDLDMLIQNIDLEGTTTSKKTMKDAKSKSNGQREINHLKKSKFAENSNSGLPKQLNDLDMLIQNIDLEGTTTSKKTMKDAKNKRNGQREINLLEKSNFTENYNSGLLNHVRGEDIGFRKVYLNKKEDITSLKKGENNTTNAWVTYRLKNSTFPQKQKQTNTFHPKYDLQLQKQVPRSNLIPLEHTQFNTITDKEYLFLELFRRILEKTR